MKKEKEKEKVRSLKPLYQPVVPLKIFQTWHTKDLPPLMAENVKILKNSHPHFEYFLFDDDDCRRFIQTHFNNDVLEAFDTLIPGAYKADLWRYCVLYIHGGIYLDIKYQIVEGFRLIVLTEKEHFVCDREENGIQGIYNGVMVCKQGNPILLQCIQQIVKNVKDRFYGLNYLQPTGPQLLSLFLDPSHKDVDLFLHILENEKKTLNYIIVNKDNIYYLQSYDEYRREQNIYSKEIHYDYLWRHRNIYKMKS
jgi:mannosyltransferase OCH1-like enzyme